MPVSADLGPKMEKYVAKLVKSGRYRSKSEVLREGIRLLQDREKERVSEFQRLIQAGLDDVEAGRTSPIADVRKRIVSRVRAAVKRTKTKRAA